MAKDFKLLTSFLRATISVCNYWSTVIWRVSFNSVIFLILACGDPPGIVVEYVEHGIQYPSKIAAAVNACGVHLVETITDPVVDLERYTDQNEALLAPVDTFN